jgi:glycosyltransferase involved in cell wall biosynthesis
MAFVNPRLVMLGPTPETRGAMAALIEAYRAHGLFTRWPINYVATHGNAGLRANLLLLGAALGRFVELLARSRGLLVHLHVGSQPGPHLSLWRDALFMALAIAARCPVIVQLHGNGLERLYERGGRALRAAIRYALEQAACVVVACEAQRTWLRGVSRRAPVAVVPHPAAPLETREGTRAPLVLFLGRLDAAKGLLDLLEAVAALRTAVPEVRLVCAGEGERAPIERYAERLGIAEAVKFTGWVGPSGKRALFENAAVFALPSYDETMPASLIEAMAAGVPAVATPLGGVPELLVDGVSGFFVAPGDTATLHRLLRRLLEDRELAARIGAAARESVRLRCAPERALARLGELYAELGLAAFDAGPAHRPVH